MKRYILIPVTLFAILLGGCNTKFTKHGWTSGGQDGFPPMMRKVMLEDLIANHQLKGLNCAQLRSKLGRADNFDDSTITYNVIMDFGHDIDPIHTKELVLKYNAKDSIIKSFEIKEWKR